MGATILAKDLSEEGIPVYSAGQANQAWGRTQKTVPIFNHGTIVVSARGSIGFPKIPREEAFTSSQTTIAITPSSEVELRFLLRFLQGVDWKNLTSGAAIPMLTIAMLSKLEVPLPPLPEQKRIADKLEAVLGRVDACRARLARVPDLLKRFRQSVLAAATSGRLTSNAEMTDWEQVPFEELLADKKKLSYGVLKPGDNDPSGVPMYRIVDIGTWGRASNSQPSYISKKLSSEFDRTVIEDGDILLSVMATIGRAMVATPEMIGANVNRAIAVIKPNREKVDSSYLNYYFLSPALVTEFEERSIGSAQVRINLTDLRTFVINLPPLSEQAEIVERIESLFAFADRIESRLEDTQMTVDRLTPSTLAKAFRGELVPQDPNDEPASTLLSRIRAEQINGKTKPKRRAMKKANDSKNRQPQNKGTLRPMLEILAEADSPIAAASLFLKCGYPADAETKTVERFYVELRNASRAGSVTCKRIGDEDYFELVKL